MAVALLAGLACLGAVAYAATGTGGREIGVEGSRVAVGAAQPGVTPQGGDERIPRVRLIEFPEATSSATDTQFRFSVPPRARDAEQVPAGEPGIAAPSRRRFQCRLDGSRWANCSSPHRLSGLNPGEHSFAVRALSRDGRSGPDAAYAWQLVVPASPGVAEEKPVEGRPFSINQRESLAALFPGDPAQPVPLSIGNPNPVPIEVTSLTATISAGSPACEAENFALTASSASPEAPLVVPAEGSVDLPSATVTAPSIALLDLPVNQDACQGAEVEIALDGEAHG